MDHSEDRSAEQSPVNAWIEDKLASLRPPIEWQPNVDVGRALLKRGQRAASFRRQAVLCAAAAAIAVGGVLAFPQPRVLAQRCVDACVAGTNGLGQFLGIKAKAGSLAIERKPAPLFALADVHGNTVNLAEMRGKVVIVNFWATWCAPCEAEIPWFTEFHERFHDRGFTVVGVSMDDDGWTSIHPYLQQRGVDYPVVLGDERLADAYGGIESLPSTFLIDKTGRVAFVHVGLVAKTTYENEIMQLIDEKETDR